MKEGAHVTGSSRGRGQQGSAMFSFMGFLILAVVVVAAFFFPWHEMSGKSQDPTLAQAEKAFAAKDWKGAVILFDKSIQTNPGNVGALVGRSKAYVQLGSLDKALLDANKAVEGKSANAKAFGQRGIVKKLLGKNDEAAADFTQATKVDPQFGWAFAQRADLFLKAGNQEKALADVNRALQNAPNFVEGLRLRAWIYNRMGKCKEASDDFGKVEKLSPNDAWSVQDRAWFLLTCPDEKIQDAGKAMELARKAVEMPGGKDGLVYETLAEAYFKGGDAAKAVEVQKKAIEMGSKKCPDGSCVKDMKERLQKYEMVARQEVRTNYEILPMDSGK
jgi:tetratricopeptide (TPR) repeat protein